MSPTSAPKTPKRHDFAVKHFFAGECFNTTVLPGGQITAQGVATSNEIEEVPFKQAVTGGTGAYKGVRPADRRRGRRRPRAPHIRNRAGRPA